MSYLCSSELGSAGFGAWAAGFGIWGAVLLRFQKRVAAFYICSASLEPDALLMPIKSE